MNLRVKVKVLRIGRYEISPQLPQYMLTDEGIALSSGKIMVDIPLDHAELMAKTDWLEIIPEPKKEIPDQNQVEKNDGEGEASQAEMTEPLITKDEKQEKNNLRKSKRRKND